MSATAAPGTKTAQAPIRPPGMQRWSYSVGRKGSVKVVIEERLDRNGALELRCPKSAATGADRFKKVLPEPHPQTVWLESGKLDELAVATLQELAAKVRAAILRGDPFEALVDPLGQAPTAPAQQPGNLVPQPASPPPLPARSATLTIRQGVDIAAPAPVEGKSLGGMLRGDHGRARDQRRLILSAVEACESVLSPGARWDELTPDVWRSAAALVAEQHRQGPRAPGLRSAERAIAGLLRCATWLSSAKKLKDWVGPANNWRDTLRADVAVVTHQSLDPKRPRYHPAEAGRMLCAVYDPASPIDPRFRLAVKLGFELRPGQVCRLRRSAIDLDMVGAFRHGIVKFPGNTRKHAPAWHLTALDRAAIEWAFRTYLADLEAAYQSGAITDYYVFCAYPLVNGRAKVRSGSKHIGKRTFCDMMHVLEQVAGVPAVAGRAAYGLRRTAVDLGPDVTDDAEVRDRMGGWKPRGLRAEIYQDELNPVLGAKVGTARLELRAMLLEAGACVPMRPQS